MTAQTIERPLPSTGPQPRTYVVEKARFPLVLKLFGLTALLIILVVGISVGITIERAQNIAKTTVDSSISGAVKLFQEFESQRLTRLNLSVIYLGHDPAFFALVESALSGQSEGSASPAPAPGSQPVTAAPAPPAPPHINYVDIADQLQQRRETVKCDLMMLLDDQGRVLGRTDRAVLSGDQIQDLYDASPLVKKIVDDPNVDSDTGVMVLENKLYHVAIGEMKIGARPRMAFILSAYAIDDTFATRIADTTKAGVVFVPSPKFAGSPTIARSSNAPSFTTMQQMSGVDRIFQTGKTIPPSNLLVDRSAYVMTGEPLTAVNQTVGAAVFLRSLDRELAPFKQIENALLLGGGGALLLAFIASWFIAKRLTRPIEELAGIAQAVTNGDYSVHPGIDRSDEVGILGRMFAKMITSLRDKAELEELYEQMAAKSAERELQASKRTSEPAKLEEGTVLVTDLRGLPPTVGEGDAANVIAEVARVMKLQESEVQRQDGTVREIVGHHLVSVFRGDRGIIHAIRAARAINEELATQNGARMSIGVGIATGEFVTGSVDLSAETGLAIVGNAPLLAAVFAWHAPSGYAYISYETAQAAGGEILASATREQVLLRWLPSPLPVASLPLVSVTTSMMKAVTTGGTMATVRMEGTVPGLTAPAMRTADLEVGLLFANRYKIDQILGRGGMGVVYKATDTQLDEVVAIKTLPGDVMSRSPEDLERFKREIRLARKITHRNVLRTYDYGEAEGVYFISMEFVRGYTLSDLLEEAEGNRMAPRVTMGIARQISRGLEAAHEQGIIHRDIKPQNVLIDHRGEVKLMDFGIARMAEAPEMPAMTQAGLIVGTPHYMSPEQVQGKPLDPRSDVYSMGVMMYEMVVGQKPFVSSSLTGVLTAHITEKPRPPIELRPEIGREINNIILKCLAKDPAERYENAGELLSDLDHVTVPAAAA